MNERFTERVAEAYGSHSQKYASVLEPIMRPMADEILSLASLNGGELVLDLATGTGLIARTASQFTDSIIGIDVSPGMLARAQILSPEEIRFVAGNAQVLPFRDGYFDLVTCGVSLSHFADVQAALREVLRVLHPSGRFITSAWGSEGQSPCKAAAVAVRNRFLEDSAVVYEGTFNDEDWGDSDRGCEILEEAGFADVRVTTLSLSGEYPNPAAAIEAALAWPLTRYRIARLDPEDQHRLREETATAILEVDDLHWRSEVHYYQAT